MFALALPKRVTLVSWRLPSTLLSETTVANNWEKAEWTEQLVPQVSTLRAQGACLVLGWSDGAHTTWFTAMHQLKMPPPHLAINMGGPGLPLWIGLGAWGPVRLGFESQLWQWSLFSRCHWHGNLQNDSVLFIYWMQLMSFGHTLKFGHNADIIEAHKNTVSSGWCVGA